MGFLRLGEPYLYNWRCDLDKVESRACKKKQKTKSKKMTAEKSVSEPLFTLETAIVFTSLV